MAPVTEIALLEFKAGAEWGPAVNVIAASILHQPGCLQVRYAQKVEDPTHLPFFIDWEDSSYHEPFEGSAGYAPFMENFGPLLVGPPAPYLVSFEPIPPTVLDNKDGKGKTAVAEVVHGYFPIDTTLVQQQAALTRVHEFVDITKAAAKGFSGETAVGWVVEDREFKGEKVRVLVFVLGWDSVEAHLAYRETESFANSAPLLRGLEGLKGMDAYHVTNHSA
jgi:quinol monooxygenase YgiN